MDVFRLNHSMASSPVESPKRDFCLMTGSQLFTHSDMMNATFGALDAKVRRRA